MSSKRKRWLILILVAALLVGVAIYILLRLMDTTSNGTVHVGAPPSDQQTAQPLNIDTPYFSTLFPAGFSLKRQTATPAAAQTHLQLLAATSGADGQSAAFTVGEMPSGGMTEVGDYHLRAAQTSSYQPYFPANLPAGAKAFRTASAPAAFTVFWSHAGQYYLLAFTSDASDTYGQLLQTYLQVIAAWQWK